MNEKTLQGMTFSNDDPLLKTKIDSFLQSIFVYETDRRRSFNHKLLKFLLEESTYLPDFQLLKRIYNDVKTCYLSSDFSGRHKGYDLGGTIINTLHQPKDYPRHTLGFIILLLRKWILKEKAQGKDVQEEESYLFNVYHADIIARETLRPEFVADYPELVLPELISTIYLGSREEKKYWRKIAFDIPPDMLIPPLLTMLSSEDDEIFRDGFIKSRKERIFGILTSINVKGLISKEFLISEYLKNKFSVGFLPSLVRSLTDSDHELVQELLEDFLTKERSKKIAEPFGRELGRLFSKDDEFISNLIFDNKLPPNFRTGVIESYSPSEPEKALVKFIDLIKDPNEQIANASQEKMIMLKDHIKRDIKLTAEISEEELITDLQKNLPITKHQRKSLVSFLSIRLEKELRKRLDISDTNIDLLTLLNEAKKKKIFSEDIIMQLHKFRKARNDTLHKDAFCPTSILIEIDRIL
ncbi:MAG: hypothetical protein ACXADY_09920 [Candidatus Hodarchaeales archaeon]|jgi:hypothetical protein